MGLKKYFEPEELFRNLRRSVFIALFILAVWLVTTFLGSALFVTSIGASAFIVFTFPAAESSRARYLFGGYITACVFGVICSFLRQAEPVQWAVVVCNVAAVFASALVMSVFDFEHPPSIALAISVVLSDTPLQMAFTALVCMTALYICKRLLLFGERFLATRRGKSSCEETSEPPDS